MAGYYGYSMSNNAMDAYASGEMPISKWRKQDIINQIEEMKECGELPENFDESEIRKAPLPVLKRCILEQTAWHHTSKLYNATDFYSVSAEAVKNFRYTEELRSAKEKKQAPQKPILAKVTFGEWGGTRKWPKLVEYTEYAIIVGDYAYLENGKRKSVNGKHFFVDESYKKAPKGKAEIFQRIRAHLQK